MSSPPSSTYHVHPVVPGRTELSWEDAELLTAFSFPWEPAREIPPTEFRALWDQDRLHFRFECVDHDLVLGNGTNAAEKVMGSDRVEIFLAPDQSLRPYYALEMDPRGELLDYKAQYHRQFDMDWTFPGLNITPEMTPNGYLVAGTIELESLRKLDVLKPDQTEFLAGVYRAEFSHHSDGSVREGWMAWIDPAVPTPDFHVPSSLGTFALIDFA